VWVNYGVKSEESRMAANFRPVNNKTPKISKKTDKQCSDLIKDLAAELQKADAALDNIMDAQSMARSQAEAAAAAQAQAMEDASTTTTTTTTGGTVAYGDKLTKADITKDIKGKKIILSKYHGTKELTVESVRNPMDVNINTTIYKTRADGVIKNYIDTAGTYKVMKADGSHDVYECVAKATSYTGGAGPDAQLRVKDGGKILSVYYNSQDGKIHLIRSGDEIYYYDSSLKMAGSSP